MLTEVRAKPVMVPAFGVIKGGRLDGWRFHFLEFQVTATGALQVLSRCTPPRWPFPWDIPLDSTHFMQLRAVVGERAKRLEALPLIVSAYRKAGQEPPDWIDDRATLRARVKRSAQRTR